MKDTVTARGEPDADDVLRIIACGTVKHIEYSLFVPHAGIARYEILPRKIRIRSQHRIVFASCQFHVIAN